MTNSIRRRKLVSLNQQELNDLWVPVQQAAGDLGDSETIKVGLRAKLRLDEIEKAAADRGIGDLLKYLQKVEVK